MGGCSGKQEPKKYSTKKRDSKDHQNGLPHQEENKETGFDRIDQKSMVMIKQGNVFNEYKKGEVLGEGSFGSVRFVKHKNSGLSRALKMIKKDSIFQEDQEKMFTEVNVLLQIDHPNIMRLYEIYQDENFYYLITEYCSGGELFERIKTMSHFSENEAANYMKQILSAVQYCHKLRIVHRDLKPENILFDSKKKGSNIRVIDFGTSRKFDPSQKLTKRLGTPYYIAPEVLDKKYDEKCDIWSCGIIMYILLCGYPPFNGNNEEEIMRAVQKAELQFDPEDWGNISEEAKSLIKKMLQKNPILRISAEEAYNDPWIQNNSSKSKLSTKVLNNLGTFQARNKFKHAIMLFIATHLITQQEKDELQKNFRIIDKDGDGQLSKEELTEGYLKIVKDRCKAEEIVESIFDQVDVNRSGQVDFSEFMVAAFNQEKLLSRNKMEQAFKLFDQDGNGEIDRQELQLAMGGSELDDKTWQTILQECDDNGDGKISRDEFINLLQQKIENGAI